VCVWMCVCVCVWCVWMCGCVRVCVCVWWGECVGMCVCVVCVCVYVLLQVLVQSIPSCTSTRAKQEVPSRALTLCAVLFTQNLDADCALFGIKVLQ